MIETGKRTLLEYLLAPIERSVSHMRRGRSDGGVTVGSNRK
jgi:hypothetical protein